MDKLYLTTAIEALGEHIALLNDSKEDMKAEIDYLRHELKECQSIVINLENEVRDKEAIIEQLKRKLDLEFIPCSKCQHFGIKEGVRFCCLFGLPFPDGTIQPETFGCNFLVERCANHG